MHFKGVCGSELLPAKKLSQANLNEFKLELMQQNIYVLILDK